MVGHMTDMLLHRINKLKNSQIVISVADKGEQPAEQRKNKTTSDMTSRETLSYYLFTNVSVNFY